MYYYNCYLCSTQVAINMKNHPFVIGISGAVGSGKTWFANRLKESIPDLVCIFTLDSYSKNEKFVKHLEFTYDNPQAIDYDKAYADLSKLLQDETIILPIYDYASHSVISEKLYKSPSVLIIEGLYAFSDSRFLDKMNIKIWIDADEDTCMKRRISRDVRERGETIEDSTMRHINDSVPAFKKYYAKGKMLSDCVYFNIQKQNCNGLILIDLIKNYYARYK